MTSENTALPTGGRTLAEIFAWLRLGVGELVTEEAVRRVDHQFVNSVRHPGRDATMDSPLKPPQSSPMHRMRASRWHEKLVRRGGGGTGISPPRGRRGLHHRA